MRQNHIDRIVKIIQVLGDCSMELVVDLYVSDQICNTIELYKKTFQLNMWENDYEICIPESQLTDHEIEYLLDQLENLF